MTKNWNYFFYKKSINGLKIKDCRPFREKKLVSTFFTFFFNKNRYLKAIKLVIWIQFSKILSSWVSFKLGLRRSGLEFIFHSVAKWLIGKYYFINLSLKKLIDLC